MNHKSDEKLSETLGFAVTPKKRREITAMMTADGHSNVSSWLRDILDGVMAGRSAVAEDREAMLQEMVLASQSIATAAGKQIALEFAKQAALAKVDHDLRMKALETFSKNMQVSYTNEIAKLRLEITNLVKIAEGASA